MRPALPPALAGHPALWQGRRAAGTPTLPTGFERLDRVLPGGGWPLGGLTELLSERPGLGELSLLLPALARLTGQEQWVLLVDPPWIPYAPAMRGHGLALERVLLVRTRSVDESLWACEQALRGVQGGAVLAWLRESAATVNFPRLRRLQLAARTGRKVPFLFRDSATAGQASPAALRLHLQADAQDLQLRVLKCRGQRPTQALRLRRLHPEPGQTTAALPTPLSDPAMPAALEPGARRPAEPLH